VWSETTATEELRPSIKSEIRCCDAFAVSPWRHGDMK
jgi:hypothetical protein